MGLCFSKKDSKILNTFGGHSDEETLSPLPKHKLIGKDVSKIKVKETFELAPELPKPESIDVSHYDYLQCLQELEQHKLSNFDT